VSKPSRLRLTNYSLALQTDGSVLAWGANASGQLGDGTTMERHTPVVVSTLTGKEVAAISIDRSEGSSSFATLTDGTVLGFGSNATGQLADGTFESRGKADQVDSFGSGSDVTVRAGTGFLLVLGPNGVLSAVGTDAFGQLGDGQNTKKNQTPSPVLVLVP
jgi:alpha-tubulin suppressor-like RCC1 family protein